MAPSGSFIALQYEGEEYHAGDFVYLASANAPGLYEIAQIFRFSEGEDMIAVRWFKRDQLELYHNPVSSQMFRSFLQFPCLITSLVFFTGAQAGSSCTQRQCQPQHRCFP